MEPARLDKDHARVEAEGFAAARKNNRVVRVAAGGGYGDGE
jgi:hypothetical protein